jgi:HPt (histidine-containing phosphotransfer) domain-containing protein
MLSAALTKQAPAASIAASETPIDLVHLQHMTLGDRSLQREVLQLFERQAEMLIARMRDGDSAMVTACAHTLKGSASGIGAFGVARAAEVVELASSADDLRASIGRLAASVEFAKAIIAELLRGH